MKNKTNEIDLFSAELLTGISDILRNPNIRQRFL